MRCVLFLALCVLPILARKSSLPTFYHLTSDLSAQISAQAESCAAKISVTSESCGSDCQIDVVDIGEPRAAEKAFYLFGEHARELVSPETALALIKSLCASNRTAMASAALQSTQFRIIPNGNPASRQQVEGGEFCLRANAKGVDLNRNWDAHWSALAGPNTLLDQLNPGKFPFSEVETKIFRDAVSQFNPTLFATIHSGTKGMYMPWAYDAEAEARVRNAPKMRDVLAELDAKFCQCPSGAAAQEVGYNSRGTCLDWVHANTNASFSYAFEIFTGVDTESLSQRYQQQLRGGDSSFLQLDDENDSQLKENCFKQFNPVDIDTYNSVVTNWAQALVELAVISHSK